MDLWVVAAAAGAGYIAKNLQNFSVDKKQSLIVPSYKCSHNAQSGSRNLLQQLREKTCPLSRLARKTAHGDVDIDDSSEISKSNGRNKEAGLDNRTLEDYDVGSISSLPEQSLDFEGGESINFTKTRRCRLDSLRPLKSSLGSWLDEKRMDDKTCLYSPVSTIRPLVVTDATRIISRSGSDSSFSEFACSRDETRRENISTSFKQFESVEELRKSKTCFGDSEPSGSSEEGFGGSIHARGPDTMLLFVIGMAFGILSATTAWKIEVDKLNKQLKQMQSLVQDLHEELDIKEMLMVTDLTDEGYLHARENDTPPTIQEPVSSPSRVKINISEKIDSVNADNECAENLELLSKIEAELQAELEMLENNMKEASLERISSVVELDPDFEPVIVRGELKSTAVNAASNSENETTDATKTDHSQPANYAVSPWELSFRLHELIESRLETRINELETALAKSQNGAQIPRSDSIFTERKSFYGETEYSSCTCDEHDKRENEGEQISMSFVSDEDRASDDEGSDESENEMVLIRQIIERRKLGASLNFLKMSEM